MLSKFNSRILYFLARILYRSELAHSAEMKKALKNLDAMSSYRSHEFQKVLAALKQFAITLESRVVLDLGCNDGSISKDYLANGAAEVIGVDIDEDAIRRANEIHSGPNIRFLKGEVRQLPLDDHSVDLIVSYDVFEHISAPPSIIAECHRVLKPGGRMLIGTWGWYHPYAPHLWAVMPVPWAHVPFSERTLLHACRLVYHSEWYIPNMHDFDEFGQRRTDRYLEESISPEYLNKFLISDFRRVFSESQFETEFHLTPFGSRMAHWTKFLLRIPYLREFFTGYLWVVCRKPASTEAANSKSAELAPLMVN